MLSDSRCNLNMLCWDKSPALSPHHVICGCSQDSAEVRTHHRGRCAKQSALHRSCSLSTALHRGKVCKPAWIAQTDHAVPPQHCSCICSQLPQRLSFHGKQIAPLYRQLLSLTHIQGGHYQLTRVPFLLSLGAAYVSSRGWDVDAMGVQCMLHKS